MTPAISVIICTRDRSPALRGALDALARCRPAKGAMEVVVVDDGSTDGTAAVCRAFHGRIPGLRHVPTETRGHLAVSRNLAVRSAEGDFLLFIDDDCIVAPDWVEAMSEELAVHPVVAGAIDGSGTGYIEECHNIAQFHRFLPGRKAGPETFIAGANMGIRRSILEELGGFAEDYRTASDTEFVLRARERGIPVHFTPRSPVRHRPGRATLAAVLGYARDHTAVTIGLRRRFRALLRTPWPLLVPELVLAAAPLVAARVTARIYLGNRRLLLRRLHTLPLVFALKLASCWGAYIGLRGKAATAEARSVAMLQ